jgi:hypothetical protein
MDAQVLAPAQWTALIVSDVLDWSPADAAALLGVSVPALAGTLQRARAAVGPAPGPVEGAALARFVGRADREVLAVTGALLREHAPPAVA